MFGLDDGMTAILLLCLFAAFSFEFINGFHDTANAVASVIYTNSLKPQVAVIWSGLWNFIGVYVGGIAVAIGIINLFPISILTDTNVSHNVAMIMALMLTAIIWNLGTWYLGLPCSSSHTMIGSIFGVGIGYGLLHENIIVALNWHKVKDVALSLFISPFIGFALTMVLILILKKYLKKNELFDEPKKKKAPPMWIRSILVLTCTSVSFTHGSNDGQKGIGLVMIILISIAPLKFALNHDKKPKVLLRDINSIEVILNRIDESKINSNDKLSLVFIRENIDSIQYRIDGISKFKQLSKEDNFAIRKDILLLSKEFKNLSTPIPDEPRLKEIMSKSDKKTIKVLLDDTRAYTEYAPWWVILMISAALGLGTMIGWKRIVVTIGEKIGKDRLSYAQGASANLITAVTIELSSLLGLPVSTTHVLSSGVAGSMVAKGGLKNLRMKTVRNIMLAWLITLPATIGLSAGLFLLFRWLL
jgi:phosphate/sulfate permease